MSDPRPRRVIVIGAGGHAKVVIGTLQAAGLTVTGIFDDDSARIGSVLLGVEVKGTTSDLLGFARAPAIIAVGDNRSRRDIAERLHDLEWVAAVHPAAFVHPSVLLGPGTVVFAGGVIQPDTVLGSHVVVNTGANVDHDCRIESFVHLAPGTLLAGGVTVREGALLCIGSAVIPGVTVGPWATVGAGGVVIDDLRGGVTAVGIPARVIKELPQGWWDEPRHA